MKAPTAPAAMPITAIAVPSDSTCVWDAGVRHRLTRAAGDGMGVRMVPAYQVGITAWA
jgi:hypothetical protein